jgi:large subunit ribosomal protein L6
MSRIGKKPVVVPSGVTATINGQTVSVKGPKGTMSFDFSEHVEVEMTEAGVQVAPRDDSKPARAAWGMSRTMISNLMKGVTEGFTKKLEINGVGYRAAVQGKVCSSLLATAMTWSMRSRKASRSRRRARSKSSFPGMDKQRVGQVAAEIRDYRSPEPYKGKGVKYATETIFRKEGKKK